MTKTGINICLKKMIWSKLSFIQNINCFTLLKNLFNMLSSNVNGKSNSCNIVVKNLRHREVPFLVTAIQTKGSPSVKLKIGINSGSKINSSNNKKRNCGKTSTEKPVPNQDNFIQNPKLDVKNLSKCNATGSSDNDCSLPHSFPERLTKRIYLKKMPETVQESDMKLERRRSRPKSVCLDNCCLSSPTIGRSKNVSRKTVSEEIEDNVLSLKSRKRSRSKSGGCLDTSCCTSPTPKRIKKSSHNNETPQGLEGIILSMRPRNRSRSKSRSVGCLEHCCSFPTPKRQKKRSYRRKSSAVAVLGSGTETREAIMKRATSTLSSNKNNGCGLPETTLKQRIKRKYQRKSLSSMVHENGTETETIMKLSTSSSSMNNECGLPETTPKARIKRKYQRKSLEAALPGTGTETDTPMKRATSISSSSLNNGCGLPETPPKKLIKRKFQRKSVYDAATWNRRKLLKASVSSLEDADITSEVLVMVPKKLAYCRKKTEYVLKRLNSKRKPKISIFHLADSRAPSATVVDVAKEKMLRPKHFTQRRWSSSTNSALDLFDDNATFMTPQKRAYRKKSSLQDLQTSKNSLPAFSDGESTTSQTSSAPNYPTKRGPGRPRKISADLPYIPMRDEELTCTSSSTMSVSTEGETKRGRKSQHWWKLQDPLEEQEPPLSEYELIRQRNIEENRKMLRELMGELELPFEESSNDDAPKPRKSYTKHPLPPPRPKSARIEVKRSSGCLDFSKFSRRLSSF